MGEWPEYDENAVIDETISEGDMSDLQAKLTAAESVRDAAEARVRELEKLLEAQANHVMDEKTRAYIGGQQSIAEQLTALRAAATSLLEKVPLYVNWEVTSWTEEWSKLRALLPEAAPADGGGGEKPDDVCKWCCMSRKAHDEDRACAGFVEKLSRGEDGK